jgi:hypothetical protein
MKSKIPFIIFATIGCTIVYGQSEKFKSPKIEKVWETGGLSVPESVYPVPDEKIMYVSNIGGQNPTEKAGNGFISILTMDGEIKNLKWVTGLNAPKGMEIVNGKLFVTDIDRLVQIDIKSGIIDKFYPIEGSKFLNDIAAGPGGELYVSETQTKKVFKFEKGYAGVFVESDDWKGPNGIIMYNGKVLMGAGDNVVQIDPTTKVFNDYLVNTGGVDGLASIGPENFIFSDWVGKIYSMKKGEEKELLLDISDVQRNAADFGYVATDMSLYIPTFYGNSIVCYRLKL